MIHLCFHADGIEKGRSIRSLYFLDLKPGEKRFVRYSVTYKRRTVGPELNTEKKREPL